MCLIFLTVFISVHLSEAQGPNNYNAKGWKEALSYLAEYMDPTAEPCSDFAGFMCRNFGNTSDNENYQSWEEERVKVMKAAMKEAIDAINMNGTSTPTYARNVKSFFGKCITNQMDASTVKELYGFLKTELGPYPPFDQASDTEKGSSPADLDQIWYLLGKLRRDFGEDIGLSPTFSVTVTPEGDRNGYTQLGCPMPRSFADTEYMRNKSIQVAKMLNIKLDLARLDEILNETTELTDDWVNNITQNSDYVDVNGLARNLSNEFSSNITWESYFRGLLTEEAMQKWYHGDGEVTITDAGATRALSEVFTKHPMRAIKTAIYGILMKSLLKSYTAEDVLDETYWSTSTTTKEDLCMEYVIQRMSPSAARVYFDHLGESIMEWRHEILLIARNVFSAMRMLLNSVDYLSPASKERINKKTDAIHFSPGIPSWIMDETRVLAASGHYNDSESLAMNSIRRKREEFRVELRKIVSPEIEEDDPPSFQVNDFFDPRPNDPHLYILLGDNLPPQFRLSLPLALKYGGLGFTIGHELMHAFDSGTITQGINQQQTILEKDELDRYYKHKQCLVEQYSSTCFKKLGGCLVGEKAMRDNIADIGGLKAAFAAYKFVKGLTGEEPPLPGMTEYTGDQLFYMTFQRYFCSRNDPKGWLSANHSPNTARAPVALRNNPHFAEAFKCAVGSKAAPVKQCKMWGEILSSGI